MTALAQVEFIFLFYIVSLTSDPQPKMSLTRFTTARPQPYEDRSIERMSPKKKKKKDPVERGREIVRKEINNNKKETYIQNRHEHSCAQPTYRPSSPFLVLFPLLEVDVNQRNVE